MFGGKMKSGGMDTLRIRLTAADPARSLDLLCASGICVGDLTYIDEVSVCFTLRAGDLNRAERILNRRGDDFCVAGTSAVQRFSGWLKGRKLLLLGILTLILMTAYLPDRVFFLKVEGNSTVSARKILAAADLCGVKFGTSREDIRSERVKNAMLELLPELQWVGVNTRGCLGIISVRERKMGEKETEKSDFGHIVALRDGVITSCSATKGNLLCAPGEAVTEGQILISGYTDCGLTIRAERAEGEIYGMTRRTVTVKTLSQVGKGESCGEERKKISLLLGKKRIFLWKDSRIWDATCDRMYEEYYVTLPGGFVLPLALCVERCFPGEISAASIPEADLKTLLEETARASLISQMAAGTIHRETARFRMEECAAGLTGEYVCIELIGKMQREKIGEKNVEND